MKDRKIGIITVYDSMNCGSFLQAYALSVALNEMNYMPVFINTKSRSQLKIGGREFLAQCRRFKFRQAGDVIRKWASYHRCMKKLQRVGQHAVCDAYILGSDELWNMKRKEMYDYPIFWGKGLPEDRTFSYAPSLNIATSIDVAKFPFAMKSLESLYSISVRDLRSKYELERLTSRNIKVVCDPTFLCDRRVYTSIEADLHRDEYIFVYEYSNIAKTEIEKIQIYAKENNKKIIAMGANHEWADEVVVSDPANFLSLMKHADGVITGTFHGTVFSIIYRKKFASLARENAKVHELLKEYNLDCRILTDGNTLEEILTIPVEEEKIECIMKQKRDEGRDYLASCLSEIVGRA